MTTENKPQISDEEKKKREANLKMIQKLSDLAVAGAINQHQNEWGKTINQAVKHYTLDKYLEEMNSSIKGTIMEETLYTMERIFNNLMQNYPDKWNGTKELENLKICFSRLKYLR